MVYIINSRVNVGLNNIQFPVYPFSIPVFCSVFSNAAVRRGKGIPNFLASLTTSSTAKLDVLLLYSMKSRGKLPLAKITLLNSVPRSAVGSWLTIE